jgi:hypothetical protein
MFSNPKLLNLSPQPNQLSAFLRGTLTGGPVHAAGTAWLFAAGPPHEGLGMRQKTIEFRIVHFPSSIVENGWLAGRMNTSACIFMH